VTAKSENVGNALFFELSELQINGNHQKSDQTDAHSEADLTVI